MAELGGERQRHLAQLLAEVQRREADGRYRIPEQQVKDLVAFMLLAALANDDTLELSPGEEAVLVDFGLRLGLSGSEPAADVHRVIASYFASHPWDEALGKAVEAAARGFLSESAGGGVGEAFSKFLGQDEKRTQALEQGQRPAGTIPAGPAARFQLQLPGESGTKGKAAKKKPKRRR